jgi:hypothetical protein
LDGHVPPYNEAARKRLAAARANPASTAHERQDGVAAPPAAFDNPEQRPLSERCLLGFGSTSGPPVLPDYFYNDLHQIVQTPDQVMILTEMIHDARIVRMNAPHLPKAIRRWMGDSVGHWEGDTLVVDTTNFNDKTRFRGSTENLRVVERFTRINVNTRCITSRSKTLTRGTAPGAASTLGRRQTSRFMNTRVTRATMRLGAFYGAPGERRLRRLPRRSKSNGARKF